MCCFNFCCGLTCFYLFGFWLSFGKSASSSSGAFESPGAKAPPVAIVARAFMHYAKAPPSPMVPLPATLGFDMEEQHSEPSDDGLSADAIALAYETMKALDEPDTSFKIKCDLVLLF